MGRKSRAVPPLGIMLDPHQEEPLFRQIAEQLRRAILERRLAPGARLPSSRLMAQELDCARGTILAALDQLIDEGYLVTRSTSGISVTDDLPDDMLVASSNPATRSYASPAAPILPKRTMALLSGDQAQHFPEEEPPLAFSIGQPDRAAFPFQLWSKLLEREWRNPSWKLAGASYLFGHPDLRHAIAAYLGTARGFACDPDSIVITSGVRQSVSLFARIVLAVGDEAWVEDPGYSGMGPALAAAGVGVVPVPIDHAGFSADVALGMAPNAKLAIVAPSHHFPLGVVMSLQRRLMLLGWAERAKAWIIEDDFDGEYRYTGRALAPLRALDRTGRVAYLGSFSKLLFPALRLSYMVLPDALVTAAKHVMAEFSSPAPLLGQGALARFIADGDLAAHLRRTRLLYANRQRLLVEAAKHHLAGLLTVPPDSGGMHLVARPVKALEASFDDHHVAARAAELGVRVSPLSACYLAPAQQHGLLLGYAAAPEHEIDLAVRKLRSAMIGQ